MSFELNAVLRLDDRMSRPMSRAMRQVERNSASMNRLTSTTERTSRAMTGLTSSMNRMRSAGSGIGKIASSVAAIGAAYVTAHLAAKAFNATIGAAAQAEATKTTITALFRGDTKTADAYFKFIAQKAAESPLSETDFLGASKSAIIMTKDIGELKQVTNIAERLAVLDPVQGLEGAMLALRELNGADVVSLAERFEMPKKVLNAIKNLPLKDQLKALDKELDKYGITQELITKQGTTALGEYGKSVDKVKMMFRDMGFGALEELKPMLRDINVWLDKNSASISKFGSGILTELAGGFRKAGQYVLTNYLENPDWMSLNFADKVKVVADDIKGVFDKWWNSSGSAMMTDISSKLISTMIDAFDKSSAQIIDMGYRVGANIASGLWKGFGEGKGGWIVKLMDGTADIERGLANKMKDLAGEFSVPLPFASTGSAGVFSKPTSFSGSPAPVDIATRYVLEGLPRNYVAPKVSAAPQKAGVNVTMNGVVVREEADINRIAGELYQKISDADKAAGGSR